MATERLYYGYPVQETLDARVMRVEWRGAAPSTGYGSATTSGSGTSDGTGVDADPDAGKRCAVILDRTILYPESGGQPCDHGTIAGLGVVAVTEEGDEVVHWLDCAGQDVTAAGIAVGAMVTCTLDLARRTDHTRQHTAQHLLSAVVMRLLGGMTVSFHLGERYSSIDIDCAPPDRATLDLIEDEVLRVIGYDFQVMTHLCPPEDAAAFPLRKEPTVETGTLRIVEIDGLDYSACCGTHVRSTSALAPFRLMRAEKYKGGARLFYLAGGRAYADYRRLSGIARELARVTGVPEDGITATVMAYRESIQVLEKETAELRERLAGFRASELAGTVPEGAPVVVVEGTVQAATVLVRAIASLGRLGLATVPAELKLIAAGPAVADVAGTVGPHAVKHGGKGGGGKTFFQAAFPSIENLEACSLEFRASGPR